MSEIVSSSTLNPKVPFTVNPLYAVSFAVLEIVNTEHLVSFLVFAFTSVICNVAFNLDAPVTLVIPLNVKVFLVALRENFDAVIFSTTPVSSS
ncbi:hypothetical protein [Synechococcus phage DSL-LC02]|nr:hypothetical protein [Synechococcus phage DSL-LC02]